MQTRSDRLHALRIVVLGLGWLLPVCAVWAQAPSTPLRSERLDVQADDVVVHPETGQLIGEGNVRIRHAGLKLEADRVELDRNTGEVAARGNVVFGHEGYEWQGDAITGNFQTKEFSFGEYRAVIGVWHVHGGTGAHHQDGSAELTDVQLTTCDRTERPHYSISARRVVYHADGRFKATNACYRIGRVPVFYLPVIYGDTDAATGNIEIKPGYDSDWGPYVLLAREWRLADSTRTKFMLDLRSKNGVALGNRTRLEGERYSTDILVYGMEDHDPPETTPDHNRRFRVEDDRYRIRALHSQALTDDLSLRLRVDAMNDVDMLEDWFRRDYRHERQARSFADLTYEKERYAVSLRARPRLNDFYSVSEVLPELRLELPRQPLDMVGLYYQGGTRAGRYDMKWRDFDEARPNNLAPPHDYDSWRIDSLHMLYRPFSVGGMFEVVPRAGLRLTYYEKSSDRALEPDDLYNLMEADDSDDPYSRTAVINYDDDGGARLRFAGEIGLEARTKLLRVWPDAKQPRLGIDGLRHVVVPYANYTYAPKPSEEREYLYFFDPVDRLLEQHFVRLGVDQRLQTRRSGKIHTLARLSTYADLHFAKERDYHHMGNVGARAELRPHRALELWSAQVGDLGASQLNRSEVGVALGDRERYRLLLSYLYRRRYEARATYSMGSSLDDFAGESTLLARRFEKSHYATVGLEYVFNPRLAGQVRFEYDIEESDLVRQLYELTRDLHCWVGALRIEEVSDDLRVMLLFYLKAFPKVRFDTNF